MRDLIAVMWSLLASYLVIMVPLGMSPRMPEFWVTPWLYGLPLLVLAWSVYLPLFHRLRTNYRWSLPILGIALSPVPFFLLIFASDAMRGDFLASHPASFYIPWRSVFTEWYALFGFMLGSWIALKTRRLHEMTKALLVIGIVLGSGWVLVARQQQPDLALLINAISGTGASPQQAAHRPTTGDIAV